MKVQKDQVRVIQLPLIKDEPWRDVPIEVLIEEERKRKESFRDNRERLYAPTPEPPRPRIPVDDDEEETQEHEDDFKIVIRL